MNMITDKNRTKRLEALFEEAIKLRDLGYFDAAINKLTEILSEPTKYDTPVLGVMGNIYWDLGDLFKSLDCYQQAVNLSPNSEMASLGLFHTLWNLGKHDEAFAEMKRFLSNSNSDEYALLLSEMNENTKKTQDSESS